MHCLGPISLTAHLSFLSAALEKIYNLQLKFFSEKSPLQISLTFVTRIRKTWFFFCFQFQVLQVKFWLWARTREEFAALNFYLFSFFELQATKLYWLLEIIGSFLGVQILMKLELAVAIQSVPLYFFLRVALTTVMFAFRQPLYVALGLVALASCQRIFPIWWCTDEMPFAGKEMAFM